MWVDGGLDLDSAVRIQPYIQQRELAPFQVEEATCVPDLIEHLRARQEFSVPRVPQ